MNWDESMFAWEEYCDEEDEKCFLTEDGIEYAKAVLELRGLTGAEIVDLESAVEGEYVEDWRIKTIFQNHASELL